MGIIQVRILESVAMPSSRRDPSQPRSSIFLNFIFMKKCLIVIKYHKICHLNHFYEYSSIVLNTFALLGNRSPEFLPFCKTETLFVLFVTKLCWLFETPCTVALQAPLSLGFPRPEYWSRLLFPSPGHIPNPGIELVSPAKPKFCNH